MPGFEDPSEVPTKNPPSFDSPRFIGVLDSPAVLDTKNTEESIGFWLAHPLIIDTAITVSATHTTTNTLFICLLLSFVNQS
jgi:hypothetical protein